MEEWTGPALSEEEVREQEERIKRLVPLARDVVMVLVKTVRATKMYLPNNPVYIKFREELGEKFESFFKEEELMSFNVGRYELTFLGQEVYQNPDKEDNMALMFFKDGVREFSFHRGIAGEEIGAFIDILKFDEKARGLDDDLVTLMWEKDFQNVTYTLADEGLGEEWGDDSGEDANDSPGAADARDAQPSPGDGARILSTGGVPGVPGALDLRAMDDGFEAVRGSFKPPDDLALLTELTDIFYDILLTEPDEERFGTVVESIGRALEIFVDRGELAQATVLVMKVRELETDERLAGRLQVLDGVMERACSDPVIKKVGACIGQGGPAAMESAGSYLMGLDTRVVGPVVGLLESVDSRMSRKALCEILVGLCAGSAAPLVPFLSHRSWFVVRNVVMVLGRVGDPEAVAALGGCLRHREAKVRRETLQTLSALKCSKSEDLLEGCLRDADGTNRIFAGRLLANMNPGRAFESFSALLREKEFERRPFEERKEFFELFGRTGREKALPMLAGRFARKGFLGVVKRDDARACAAYGLAAAGGDEAYGLLKTESGSKSKLLRNACLGGLRRMDRAKEASDA